MKLSHVQHKRFVKGIPVLEDLISQIFEEVPAPTVGSKTEFKTHILASLKEAPLDEYLRFELNKVDLALMLKVRKNGQMAGHVHMKGWDAKSQVIHFRLNFFIEGSLLRDPDIEYYECTV